jgi:hypothetical protein
MRWIEGKRLTKKKVALALRRGRISWGRTVTTEATAASARARRSRRGVVISGGAFDLPVTSRLGFDYNQPLEERVFVQILPILWANCELNSKIQFKISHPRV